MPVYDITGGLKTSVADSSVIQVQQTGSLVRGEAAFINFTGTAVTSVTNNGQGVDVTLTAGGGGGSVQWTEGSPSPRIATTASVAISGLAEFAETKGTDVFFYVSGSVTTGSSADNVALFGGSIVASGNLYLDATNAASQSYIQFPITQIPAAPAAGQMKIFGRSRASRAFPVFMGPSGLDTLIQPALFGNAVYYLGTNTTTTLTSFGTNFTTSGTVAHNTPIIATVSGILGYTKNARFTPAAAIGNGAGFRTTDTVCWRGNHTGSGGFFAFCRFGVFINAESRCFTGFNSANAFNGHTTDISASTNFIGIGWDRQDPLTGTWRMMRRDGSTYVTEEIPNMIRTSTTGSLISFYCFAAPNSDRINVQVIEHISTSVGIIDLNRWETFYTTSIPTTTTLLRYCGGIFTQTGSRTGNYFLNRFYLETDY